MFVFWILAQQAASSGKGKAKAKELKAALAMLLASNAGEDDSVIMLVVCFLFFVDGQSPRDVTLDKTGRKAEACCDVLCRLRT